MEEPRAWQSNYYKKEGASARQRQESLYSEAFTVPIQDQMMSRNQDAENLESLIKVRHFQLKLSQVNIINPRGIPRQRENKRSLN
jgi:hypothetical protein